MTTPEAIARVEELGQSTYWTEEEISDARTLCSRLARELKEAREALSVAKEALATANHVLSALRQASGVSLNHYPLMAQRLMDEHTIAALARIDALIQ